MRLSAVLACLAILQPLGVPGAAQPTPTPTPGALVVLGADGQLVADASVTVIQPSRAGLSPVDAFLVRSETEENGVVEGAVPRLRGLTVIVDHPAHQPFVAAYANRPPPEVIRLQPGRTAKGFVREAGGGLGVAGASVCASWRDPSLPEWFGTLRRCTDSGERGAYELPGLAAGNLQATAEAPGFETDARTIEQGRRTPRVEFELVASEQSVDEAPPAPTSAGAVLVELVGAAGEPIRNFTMRTNGVGRMAGSSHGVEDAEGPVVVPIRASFAGDAAVDLSFRAENYLESPLVRVAPIPGGEIELGLIALESGAVVQGRLFDAVGAEPAAGCVVELLYPGPGAIAALMMSKRHLTVSDAEGRYLIGGLRAGRYHLRLQCPGAPVTDRLVVLGKGELADQGESWLNTGRPVAVRVRGLEAGMARLLDRFREIESPIVETALRSSSEAGAGRSGDEDSTVQAEFLAVPGLYRLEIVDGAGRLRVSQEIGIEEGPADVQTVDVSLATRTIRSMLALDGRPATGGTVSFGSVFEPSRSTFKIQLSSQRRGGAQQSRMLGVGSPPVRATVGTDGSFEVDGVADDLLWMTWYAGDGSYLGRLWPADPVPRMDLTGVRVTGSLLDVNGTPVGGQVSLIGDLSRVVAFAEAGDDGRFVLPPVPPGSYRLKGSAGVSPSRAREGRSSLAGTAVQDLVITTEPPVHQFLRVEEAEPGVLEVELRRADGSPAGGIWLNFVNAAGDVVGGGLASAGGQRTRSVPTGEVNVVWNDAAACAGSVGLNVEANRTSTLRESLPVGRLLELRCPAADCAGEPLSFLSVTTESGAEIASHLTGAGEAVRFSESGRLGLGCVTPGSYDVSFWAAGRRWGAEFRVSSRGAPEEPVIVNGLEAGL
ncbi:MAG: carboxypeptidase-like regulatory domain-containing protein [Acidobacteria bacterium]|nr:carboxypeptidase-like regulatory domain-containing protein [Acidobacteriota bacterium]